LNVSFPGRENCQGSDLLKTLAVFLEEQNITLPGGWPVYCRGIGLREMAPDAGKLPGSMQKRG